MYAENSVLASLAIGTQEYLAKWTNILLLGGFASPQKIYRLGLEKYAILV